MLAAFHHLIIPQETLFDILRAFAIIFAGLLIGKYVSQGMLRFLQKHNSKHTAVLTSRIIFYAILAIFLISALRQLGFNLNVVLGATGIVTVAFGFAAQTSASNIISGIFLITERSFVVGDTIAINGIEGEVIAIDLLSVKLRRADNTLVRIPNEMLIKTQFTNYSAYPHRRIDLNFPIALQENFAKVKDLLKDITLNNKLCLQEPAPDLNVIKFNQDAIDLQFSVWTTQKNFQACKNALLIQIKEGLLAEKISLPQSELLIKTGNSGLTLSKQ